jgi:hypothetical protein
MSFMRPRLLSVFFSIVLLLASKNMIKICCINLTDVILWFISRHVILSCFVFLSCWLYHCDLSGWACAYSSDFPGYRAHPGIPEDSFASVIVSKDSSRFSLFRVLEFKNILKKYIYTHICVCICIYIYIFFTNNCTYLWSRVWCFHACINYAMIKWG